MYHLVWKDHDGHYHEKFKNHIDFARGILEVYRKENAEDYGTEIIAVINGAGVNCEYKVDIKNYKEEIYLYGDLVLTNNMSDPTKIVKTKCPVCGSTSYPAGVIPTFVDDEYSTLDRYKCDKCDKEFYL